jgi:cephalosporin hydroxylase
MNGKKADYFKGAGHAMWEQRVKLQKSRSRLEALGAAVGRPGDMDLPQYAQLFAVAMEFQPDLIVEIGRGWGNSTCVLTEAANQLEKTKVVSFCRSDTWQKRTLPRVATVVPPDWTEILDARVADVTDVDIGSLLAEGQRILFLLDAHGWEVAEYVLGVVLPAIQNRSHLIVVHDILDVESHPELRSYAGHGIWKGYSGYDAPQKFVFSGSMCSMFEEVVSLVDFAVRNRIEIHSVEREIRQEIDVEPDRRAEMISMLGDGMCSPVSRFHWFSLNSEPGDVTFTFHRFQKDRLPEKFVAFRMARDLRRFNRGGRPSIVTFALIFTKMVLGLYKP